MSHSGQAWYDHDQPQSHPDDFSTLEVALQASSPNDTLKELQSPSDPEPVHLGKPRFIGHVDAPEVTQQSISPAAVFGPTSPALSPFSASSLGGSSGVYLAEKGLDDQATRPSKRICGTRSIIFWLLLALAVSVIAVAICVPVGVIVGRKHTASSTAISSDHPAIRDTGVSNHSSLASIAFNDTQGLTHYRIYYQDDLGNIKESSWNSSGRSWYVTNKAIGSAKPGTPLSAIVTGPPNFPFQINLYAIAGSGQLIAWGSVDTDWTSGNTTFSTGPITQQGIVPANNSDLAAYWDRSEGCLECSNTLNIVYQLQSGQLQLGNLTNGGWEWYPLQASPIMGTSLAIDLKFFNGTRDILLYYQLPSKYVSALRFNGSIYNWEELQARNLPQLASNAPIASVAYDTPNSNETLFEQLLSASVNGTSENYWNSTTAEWGLQQYPSMLQQNYTSLATNEDGRLYLMKDGIIHEFMFNLSSTWSIVGNVTTS